jgi:hypothetical protein
MLRPVRKPTSLSPERQALADAIAERDATKAEFEAVQRAAGGWDSPARQAVRQAEAALEEATAAIEKALQNAATYLVEQASGAGTPPAVTIADARRDEQTARDNLAAAESALATLKARIGPAEDALGWKEMKVRDAVEAVLKAAPETEAVLVEVENAMRVLWQHGAVLQAIHRAGALDLRNVETPGRSDLSRANRLHGRMHQPPMYWPDFPPAGAVGLWNAAVKALHTDASTVLPTP